MLDGGWRGFLRRSWALAILFGLVVLISCTDAIGGKAGKEAVKGLAFWVVLLSFIKSGSVLHLGDPQRLYLLGVDYRCQLHHFLRTFWMTPALMVVSLGALLSMAVWGRIEMPLTLLAVVAGLTLLRAGWGGWPGLPVLFSLHGGRIAICSMLVFQGLLLWTGFLVLAGSWAWLPDPNWDTWTRAQLFAIPCGVCGAAFVLYKWVWLTEARMTEAMQTVQQTPMTEVMQTIQQTAPAVRPSDTLGS
jgi:hypothetical protein